MDFTAPINKTEGHSSMDRNDEAFTCSEISENEETHPSELGSSSIKPDIKKQLTAASEANTLDTSLKIGTLGGTRFLDAEGFIYFQHSTSLFRRQLRCIFSNIATIKCRARASVLLDPPDSPIILSPKCPPHNHPPENDKTVSAKFSRVLKQRVLNEPDTSIQQIYCEESKKDPLGAQTLTKATALQRMCRYRRAQAEASGVKEPPDPLSDDENPPPSREISMLNGRIVYVDHKGYQYYHHHGSANKRQLRCTKARIKGQKCPARASMNLNPRCAPIHLKRRHNHPPPDSRSSLFIYNLKERARNESKSLKEIYEEEAEKDPQAAESNPFSSLHRTLQRARRTSKNMASSSIISILGDEEADQPLGNVNDPSSDQLAESDMEVPPTQACTLNELVFYECSYCKKLFEAEAALQEHVLNSHILICASSS